MIISLVTLSFNQRQFLERTLHSVFQQKYPELEYIIVDPGSSDGSRDLIEKHRERFTRIVFESDNGPADGLNKGFQFATGQLLGFLNADDILLPRSLERVSKYFSSHPECDVLMGDGLIIDENDQVLRHLRVRPFTVPRYLYGGVAWMQQSTFFRAEVFRAVGGFNTANRSSWDGELFLTMAKRGACIMYLHDDLACFRLHGGSITSRVQVGGTDSTVLAYRENAQRMFESIMGRSWRFKDDFRRLAVRLGGMAVHPSAVLQAILHRIRQRKA